MKNLSIAFISYGEITNHPSTFYRSYRMAEELEKIGYNTNFYSGILPDNQPNNFLREVNLFRKRLLLSVQQILEARKYDIVYVNKKIHPYSFPPILVYLLKYSSDCTIIYDTCDPIWEHNRTRVNKTFKIADAVVVAGESLKKYAENHNENVFIVPMAIEIDKFKPIDRPKNGKPVIGWVGNGPEYKEYLQLLINPLTKLSEEFDFKFFLTSARGDEKVYELFNNAPFECEIRDWVPEDELVETMNEINIGVVPLLETDWAKGKSPIKILEYSACGIPVVSSNVGDARQMVRDGEDGYLVSNEEEWYQRLRELLSHEELRTQMGENGRQKAVNEYGFEATAGKLAEIIEQIHNTKKTKLNKLNI